MPSDALEHLASCTAALDPTMLVVIYGVKEKADCEKIAGCPLVRDGGARVGRDDNCIRAAPRRT